MSRVSAAGEVVAAIARVRPRGPVMIALGGFGSPIDAPCDRVGVFAAEGDALAPLADVWVRTDARAELLAAFARRGDARVGAWDVLFATAWTHAWTDDGGPFVLWTPDGVSARVEGGGLWRRGCGVVPRAAIEAVEVRLSPDWSLRSVVAVGRDGAWTVAEEVSRMPAIDPTYDGIDLMVDLGWLLQAGRALGAGLGVEVRDRTGEV